MHEKRWVTLFRPGFLGAVRSELFASWTEEFGPNQWRLVWKVNDFFTDYLGACALYEDAYYHYFRNNATIKEELTRIASEVYDDRPSNIEAGLDYRSQETSRTHIQDIAIRRSLVRLGVWFRGKQPIRIRQEKGFHPLSLTLSPGNVPFHLPNLIVKPELVGWWKPESVEAFYQSGRYLQVTKIAWDMVRRSRPKNKEVLIPQAYARAFLVSSSFKELIPRLRESGGNRMPYVVFSKYQPDYFSSFRVGVGREIFLLLCEDSSNDEYPIWACYELQKPEQGFREKNLAMVWNVKAKGLSKYKEVTLPEIPSAIEELRHALFGVEYI